VLMKHRFEWFLVAILVVFVWPLRLPELRSKGPILNPN
jgi:hypothetical protein